MDRPIWMRATRAAADTKYKRNLGRDGPTSIYGYSTEYPNILAKCLYLNVLYNIYKKDKVPSDMKYELAQLALIRRIDL
jgi:hypothetical protein